MTPSYLFSLLFSPSLKDCENPRGVDESESPGFCKANFQAEYLSPLDR